MTYTELSAIVAETRPNTFTDAVKKRWIKNLEKAIVREIVERYASPDGIISLRYKGTCDASEMPDVINAEQGDYYVLTGGDGSQSIYDYMSYFYQYWRRNLVPVYAWITVVQQALNMGSRPTTDMPTADDTQFINERTIESGDLAICVVVSNQKRWYLARDLLDYADYAVDNGQMLLAPAPYDELYRYYLELQIDYAQTEYERYQNSQVQFNNEYGRYERFAIQKSTPRATGFEYI